MVHQRFRNCVKQAQTITGRKANMQHTTTQCNNNNADMRKTSKKLQKNPTPESGTEIAYNIQGLKLRPGKLQNIRN